MSAERALHLVDTLLDVLQEADRRAVTGQQKPTQTQTSQTVESKSTQPETLFKSYEDITEGQLIQVTSNVDILRKEWNAADMGKIEDLKPYVNQIGKVIDIEDDDTVQVEWGNYDSFWLPVLACHACGPKAQRSIPGSDNSWLMDKGDDKKEESKEDYWTSIEDDGVKTGNTARVTTDREWLLKCWKESELGPSDGIDSFLGCVGSIQDTEEDDDTIQLRWENFDESWLPVKACSNANGAKPTLPGTTVSWLS